MHGSFALATNSVHRMFCRLPGDTAIASLIACQLPALSVRPSTLGLPPSKAVGHEERPPP